MLDGRWLYVAAVPIAFWTLARRTTPGRMLVALVALAHVAILANVALFPIPADPVLVAAGRAAAATSSGDGGLRLVPLATIGPVLAGEALPEVTRIAILNVFVLAPAGVYLPLLFGSLRSRAALLPLAIVGGASVEGGQLAISSLVGFHYRTVDIDDVILNAVGIVVGWVGLRIVLRVRTIRAGQKRSTQDVHLPATSAPAPVDQAPPTNR
jgi:glycopeptide antibiotics resistance protein